MEMIRPYFLTEPEMTSLGRLRTLRVLGVDPGTFKMGVGVVDADRGELALAYSSVLVAPKRKSLAERLRYMHDHLVEVVQRCGPAVVAIEEPFVARNVRAAMAVGHAQAVAMLVAAQHELDVATYSPREVKRAVTDYGASSKGQVQEMVGLLLGLPATPPSSDEADALAVAICHVNASRAEELAATGG